MISKTNFAYKKIETIAYIEYKFVEFIFDMTYFCVAGEVDIGNILENMNLRF